MKKGKTTSTISMPDNLTSAQLENLSGLTERRLRQLADAAKIPQPKDGKWPTVETIRGLLGHYRTQRASDALNAAKLSKLEHETRLLEQTFQEREGRLVDRAAMLELMQRGLRAMTMRVLGMTDLPIEQREDILHALREAGSLAATPTETPAENLTDEDETEKV